MDKINELIAIQVLGWEYGNFKNVDGKNFTLRDKNGNLYFENDIRMPDFYNNDSQSIEILSCFNNIEITKFSHSSFRVIIRHKGKLSECFGEKFSKTLSRCALLAVGISSNV